MACINSHLRLQRQGGPEFAYRLASRPAAGLRTAGRPSGVSVRGGGHHSADGLRDAEGRLCRGEIDLALKERAGGRDADGGRVPACADQVAVTLTAGATAQRNFLEMLAIEGRAKIDGRTVSKRAVPAENMMQAFAYWHVVPSEELESDVSDRFASKFQVRSGI